MGLICLETLPSLASRVHEHHDRQHDADDDKGHKCEDDEHHGHARRHAAVHVHVPGVNARAVVRMAFESPAGSSRDDWAEFAYEKALMMLDPA